MFVGRKKEKKRIEDFLDGNNHSLLIYGKRRVGKTELIKRSFGDRKYVYFECSKDTISNNAKAFVASLSRHGYISGDYEATSFSGVFSILDMLNTEINVVIDEYPYLYKYEDSKKVDSQFQNIIDNYLSNVKLIICGSNVAVMTSLLEEGNALFGRFDEVINLKELSYLEAQQFYKDKSVYDKIGFYSVFGGSPYLNRMIKPELDLKTNIINNFLDEESPCYKYCENLLFTDVPSSTNINAICTTLKNGKKSCSEIENSTNSEKNGGMNKKLDLLTRMGLITKCQPINKKGNQKATRYELNDNAVRFFYSFVYQNKSILQVIGGKRFFEEYIEDKLITFISHRFEEIARSFFSISVKNDRFKDIIDIGTYYYDDPVNKTNGEFDVALKLKNGSYRIVEVKYYKNNILSLGEMRQEAEQVDRIKELNIDSIVFISTSGCEKNEEYESIDIGEVYREQNEF